MFNMPTLSSGACERSIVSNDATEEALEEEGFVNDNADLPCRGHLGFFAVFAGTVNYEELVAMGRTVGLPGYGPERAYVWDRSVPQYNWDGWMPRPRSGSRAFAYAVKDLERTVGWVETDEWTDRNGNNRAWVSYETVMIRNQREYKLVRRWRGRNVQTNNWDSLTEDIFRIRYVAPERKSNLARWRRRYVDQTLGRLEAGTPRAEPSELSALFEVTPFNPTVLVDANQLASVNRTLTLAMQRECTTVDQDALRAIVRYAIKSVGGIQFGGSSGGVYYIPDWDRNQAYMRALVPFSELINWFGESNREQSDVRYNEDGSVINTDGPLTTLRLLGYVDSARQMEYLRQDIAREVSSSVNSYYDDLLRVVQETGIEDLPKEIDRLFRERRDLTRRLGNMRTIVGEGIQDALQPKQDVQTLFDERLGAITTHDQAQANRLRQLMRVAIELDDDTGDE